MRLKANCRLLILCILFVVGCGESDNTVSTFVTGEEGAGQINFVDYVGDNETLKYTHRLGDTPQDVYFIFTNPTSSDITSNTVVSARQEQAGDSETTSMTHPSDQSLSKDPLNGFLKGGNPGLRDRPAIVDIGSRRVNLDSPALQKLSRTPQAAESLTPGSSHVFLDWDFNKDQSVSVTATLQKVIDTSTDIVLYLWVEDASWSPCNKSKCMNVNMLSSLGSRFLETGESNDIHDWLTDLFGLPWGEHSNPAYIAESYKNRIDILFYDIDADNSTNGGVLGFFWSKDNAIRNEADQINYTDISNERLMFYIDSVLAATEENSTWEITDRWPSEIVATLAHEFQHMIHFYQKTLTRAETNPQTWLNEMCSLVAEDLVADKIQVDGPRGVSHDTYTAGSANNSDGRLPWFNNYNYLGLTDWYSGDGVYYSYATSYAFGAYLARNFGGASLFRNIVHNQYTDSQAVTHALSELGYDLTFPILLRQWGVAVVLSDNTTNQSGFQYNSNGSFLSETEATQYNLGSINLFNYSPEPNITEAAEFTLASQYKTANRYFKTGSKLTGSKSWYIGMPKNTMLTVVTRDSE
jgi:Peptidase M30